MNKEEFCVSMDYTLLDVMEVIETIRERAVIIVSGGKVCGLLTLGDIIKALSEGVNIHARIEKLYNPHFTYLNEYDLGKAFDIFKQRYYSIIPIIDNEYHLIEVITPRDIMNRLHFE